MTTLFYAIRVFISYILAWVSMLFVFAGCVGVLMTGIAAKIAESLAKLADEETFDDVSSFLKGDES